MLFKLLKDAQDVAESLAKKGVQVRILKAFVRGERWWEVHRLSA